MPYYAYKGNKPVDPNIPPERFPNRIPMNYGRYVWWPDDIHLGPGCPDKSAIAHCRSIPIFSRNGFMLYWYTNFKDATTFRLIHKEEAR